MPWPTGLPRQSLFPDTSRYDPTNAGRHVSFRNTTYEKVARTKGLRDRLSSVSARLTTSWWSQFVRCRAALCSALNMKVQRTRSVRRLTLSFTPLQPDTAIHERNASSHGRVSPRCSMISGGGSRNRRARTSTRRVRLPPRPRIDRARHLAIAVTMPHVDRRLMDQLGERFRNSASTHKLNAVATRRGVTYKSIGWVATTPIVAAGVRAVLPGRRARRVKRQGPRFQDVVRRTDERASNRRGPRPRRGD